MEVEKTGFSYPRVDTESCVRCGTCDRTCPALSTPRAERPVETLWVRAKDLKTRVASSSGGVFSLLADKALDAGGIVVGAAFDDDLRGVSHVVVTSKDALGALRSSKYLQSRVGRPVYHAVREALAQGRRVLFSGVACQVAGLRGFLGARAADPNLLCVDVVCHGAPSPELWARWATHLEGRRGSRLVAVSFRDKRTGWSSYSVSYRFADGGEEACLATDDWYAQAFSTNASLRPSCFSCPSKGACGSDLTLGDYWGVQTIEPTLRWADGLSAVAVRTERGSRALGEISSEADSGGADFDRVASTNDAFVRPAKTPELHRPFMEALASGETIGQLMERFPLRRPLIQRLISRLGVLRSRLNRMVGR